MARSLIGGLIQRGVAAATLKVSEPMDELAQALHRDFAVDVGNDNLAIHRFMGGAREPAQQRLDHIGFVIDSPAQVDVWHEFLVANDVRILKAPKTHRDGAHSFYCLDPDGNVVQMIYHPPISGLRFSR